MRERGGAVTTTWLGKPVTVLRVQWQVDDAKPLATAPTIVGRAIVDTADGGRFHAILVQWDETTLDVATRSGRIVKASKTGAMFWDRGTNAFVVLEI